MTQRETVEAIVRDRIKIEMLLRCLVQGCVPIEGVCRFCRTPSAQPAAVVDLGARMEQA